MALITMCLGVTAASFYEIYEWVVDHWFGQHLFIGETDTVTDLADGFLGAGIGGLFLAVWALTPATRAAAFRRARATRPRRRASAGSAQVNRVGQQPQRGRRSAPRRGRRRGPRSRASSPAPCASRGTARRRGGRGVGRARQAHPEHRAAGGCLASHRDDGAVRPLGPQPRAVRGRDARARQPRGAGGRARPGRCASRPRRRRSAGARRAGACAGGRTCAGATAASGRGRARGCRAAWPSSPPIAGTRRRADSASHRRR